MLDDLDQWHLRHRIEEMDTAEPLRPLQPRHQRLEQQRRGVGGQDGVGPHRRLAAGENLRLDIDALRHRLDHQIGAGKARAGRIRRQPVERRPPVALVADAALEQLVGAADGRRDQPRLAVFERHQEAAQRRHRRNVAAHHAGSHHMHPADAVFEPLGIGFELLAQKEAAHQIVRCLAHHEMGEAAGLFPPHRRPVAVIVAEQLDHGVGCGIMRRPRLLLRLAAHATRHGRAGGRESRPPGSRDCRPGSS